MKNSKLLQKSYSDWIMTEWSFSDISNQVVEIRIPFFDQNSSYMIIYAEFLNNGKMRLSDDGWTLDNLKSQGYSCNEESNSAFLNTYLEKNGIVIKGNEIQTITDIELFPLAKQRFLQAIIYINAIKGQSF